MTRLPLLALLLTATPALAQQPSSEVRALSQMLGEAQSREAYALARAYRAEADAAAAHAEAEKLKPREPKEPSP